MNIYNMLSLDEIDDYYIVTVENSEMFFTAHKKYEEWGCGPRDNWPTFQKLVKKIGQKDSVSTIKFLNEFVSRETGQAINYI